jgi:hypothetical protein
MADLPAQEQAELDGLIAAGRKIEAIKRVRGGTGMGLKEAKDLVDAREQEMRQQTPERFATPSGRTGCLGVVLLAVSVAVVLWQRRG